MENYNIKQKNWQVRHKIIFGKVFDDVCGCTFRIDNPKREDLSFLKEMAKIRIKEITNKL